ncbi:uncharacterized protein LOC128922249 [Zeugodacus cucurbitae]|uniref:uncharacterized protein LOC128922249 n=1 Tax=Zeugodacus cucurbitae TaxID=28588 RepID=UPI0023D9694A|nr:uncharacterized protein LOC128922249 [Zeugodacus cucurbitae]
MKSKSLYLPALIVAFLLASEIPKVHGLLGVINRAGKGASHLLRGTAGVIDSVLIKPTPRRPSTLEYTIKMVVPLAIAKDIGKTKETSRKPNTLDKDKGKSKSTKRNKSESGDNKNSVANDSSTDSTN